MFLMRNKKKSLNFPRYPLLYGALCNCAVCARDTLLYYSKIPILRPPFGLPKSGLISEMVLISNMI